jgi:hypothetical protein
MTTRLNLRPHPVRHARLARIGELLRGRLRHRLRGDQGQIAPWTIFGAVIVVLLAAIVYDGGMSMADQVRLYDRAQAAARAGASQMDLAAYRATGAARLDPAAATTAARRFLAASGTTGTVTATTDTVTVTVTAERPTRLLGAIGVTSTHIDATASAFAVTG